MPGSICLPGSNNTASRAHRLKKARAGRLRSGFATIPGCAALRPPHARFPNDTAARASSPAPFATRTQAEMVFPHIDWLFSFSGLCVGVLVGLTGVGGGSLMTPLLVLLFGVHPATAVGTDLLYAAVTKTAGTFAHGIQGSVDWRITGRLATGSLPATIATLIALHHYGVHQRGSGGVIQAVLGVALLITAVSLIFRPQLAAFAARHAGELSESRATVLTIAVGVVLGVLVSMTSVGAGAIGVTALLLLYPSLPTSRIVGSDIAHAVPLTLVAGIGHWILGSVDVAMLLSLLVGSIPGIAMGSYLSSRAPEGLLRKILAATLLLVGGRLVFA